MIPFAIATNVNTDLTRYVEDEVEDTVEEEQPMLASRDG